MADETCPACGHRIEAGKRGRLLSALCGPDPGRPWCEAIVGDLSMPSTCGCGHPVHAR